MEKVEEIQAEIAALSLGMCAGAHRETQLAEIEALLEKANKSATPMTVVLKGTPGTGKTSTMNHFLTKNGYKHAVWNPLYEQVRTADAPERFLAMLPTALRASDMSGFYEKSRRLRQAVPVLIDEFDHVSGALLPLLAPALRPPSRLFLVVATNDMDQRYDAATVAFPAYTAAELAQIIRARLGDASLISPPALRLIAAASARRDGDARLALSLAARALSGLRDEIFARFGEISEADAVVRPRHVLEDGASRRIELTPRQTMCLEAIDEGSLRLIRKRMRNAALERGIPIPTSTEVVDALSNLECLGLVRLRRERYELTVTGSAELERMQAAAARAAPACE
eukprot:gnl/Chilomastix_cuspidata/2639.p2 GENE.gnl/Chilomastix_cuspidata/2639~~gnl/Chilomastix_cuspidata/2639.p2  ORF type:complete len:341 (-),score=108.74 gnl/Chilomastix_cuspidata/2639:33-1055(-)